MNEILASTQHQPARQRPPVRPASRRHQTVTALRNIIATWCDRTWRERIRFRWQLRQMARDNPHLIDDIGLTKREVEAEIAKRFWQR